MKNLLLTLFFVCIITTNAFSDRKAIEWLNLIESSDIIARAIVEKIDASDFLKTKVFFRVTNSFKGTMNQEIIEVTIKNRFEDEASIDSIGSYFLFLNTSTMDSFLPIESFFKVVVKSSPNLSGFSIIDPECYKGVKDFPEELFTEKQIIISEFGQNLTFKAKLITDRALEL